MNKKISSVKGNRIIGAAAAIVSISFLSSPYSAEGKPFSPIAVEVKVEKVTNVSGKVTWQRTEGSKPKSLTKNLLPALLNLGGRLELAKGAEVTLMDVFGMYRPIKQRIYVFKDTAEIPDDVLHNLPKGRRQQIRVMAPVHTEIISVRPTFYWSPLPAGLQQTRTTYTLKLWDTKNNLSPVWTTRVIGASCTPYPESQPPLQRGHKYWLEVSSTNQSWNEDIKPIFSVADLTKNMKVAKLWHTVAATNLAQTEKQLYRTRLYIANGLYLDAKNLLDTPDFAQRFRGTNRLEALRLLGAALYALGESEKASMFYKEAVKTCLKMKSPDPMSLAISYRSLAEVQMDLGDDEFKASLQKAYKYFRDAGDLQAADEAQGTRKKFQPAF